MTNKEALRKCKDWFSGGCRGKIDALAFSIAVHALEDQILKGEEKDAEN